MHSSERCTHSLEYAGLDMEFILLYALAILIKYGMISPTDAECPESCLKN
jgi:hypothetical protein